MCCGRAGIQGYGVADVEEKMQQRDLRGVFGAVVCPLWGLYLFVCVSAVWRERGRERDKYRER